MQRVETPGQPETDMHESPQYDEEEDNSIDSIEMFTDPVDDDPSDIESFGADDLFGSDPDSEIIWTQAQMERQPPSSNDQLVWPLPLCKPFHLFTYETGY